MLLVGCRNIAMALKMAVSDAASLVADKAGNGYGATSQGGSRLQGGVVYEITP